MEKRKNAHIMGLFIKKRNLYEDKIYIPNFWQAS